MRVLACQLLGALLSDGSSDCSAECGQSVATSLIRVFYSGESSRILLLCRGCLWFLFEFIRVSTQRSGQVSNPTSSVGTTPKTELWGECRHRCKCCLLLALVGVGVIVVLLVFVVALLIVNQAVVAVKGIVVTVVL